MRALPATTIAHSHIGNRRPSVPADLPAIVVFARRVTEAAPGIGGLVGSRALSPTQWSTGTAMRSTGIAEMELWTVDHESMDDLAALVFPLAGDRLALEKAGFLQLSIRSVGPVEQVEVGEQANAAVRMGVTCRFEYEEVSAEEVGPGGIIRQLAVRLDGEVDESFEVK
jgi:hypothetical protein